MTGQLKSARPDALLDVVRRGVCILDLAQPLANGIPCSPNHPGFRMALARRHGDMVRADGGSSANEIIVTGGHVGTHVDALAHASHKGKLYGGIDCADALSGGVFAVHGVENIPPMVCPGVLLDVAAVHGTCCLPPGYGISADDLDAALAAAGVPITPGAVCLVHTGWSRWWDDAERYVGTNSGVPGLTESGADWLVARRIIATGADTTAFEQIHPGRGHAVMPVHRILLVENGIHIIEHMNLEAAATEGLTEFLFVMAPLRIVGGTGSPVRPFAAVAA
jgi:kynurenine formamidase